MTASPKLDAWLDTLPDRCPSCRWHIPTQNHAPTCGDALRAEAFAQLDAANDAATGNALLRREIIALGHRKMEFTADDLPQSVRESTNPNRRGRVFAALVDDGVIREVGRAKSRNPRAHGKSVGVFRLT